MHCSAAAWPIYRRPELRLRALADLRLGEELQFLLAPSPLVRLSNYSYIYITISQAPLFQDPVLTREEWVLLGKRRIINILRDRLLASEKQLEAKIAEAGPTDQLCNPHILSSARLLLEKDGKIDALKDSTGMPFYFLPHKFNPSFASHATRRDELFQLYDRYRTLTQVPEYCGQALETVIWEAIRQSNEYLPIGSQTHQQVDFGEVKLPGKLDMILLPKNRSPVAALVEAKNLREWIYPSNYLIWKLIEKALVFQNIGYPTVPVLVARKIQQSTRSFFKAAGILGLDTHFQYFDPKIEEQLVDIRDVNGLGFKDIRIIEPPQKYVLQFFSNGLPKQAPDFAARFAAASPILRKYTPYFADKSNGFGARTKMWRQFSKELKIHPEYDDYD